MPLVLPGPGLTTHNRMALSGTEFGVLGPVPAGVTVDRLDVRITVSGAVAINFGAAIGPSRDANAESLRAGRTLVQRSDTVLGTVPLVRATLTGQGIIVWSFPIGLVARSGSRYVVYEVTIDANENVHTVASLFTLQLFRTVEEVEQTGV